MSREIKFRAYGHENIGHTDEKHMFYWKDVKPICQVIWEGGGFTIKEGETTYNLGMNLLESDGTPLVDIEIIGNIYENPELLENDE